MSADGQAACAVDGALSPASLKKLIEIEETLSRLVDMSHLMSDLAASAREGNEIMAGSLYFLSEVLLREATRLQELYGNKTVGR